jgi:hypothetical protein
MNRTKPFGVICFSLLLAGSAFASRLDVDDSEYGQVLSSAPPFQTCLANGGSLSSDFTGSLTPPCLNTFTAETFISPSILANSDPQAPTSVAIFDFKLNANVVSDTTLTLTGSAPFYLAFGPGFGAFVCDPNNPQVVVQCFDVSQQSALNALHAVGFSPGEPTPAGTTIGTFTIPAGTGAGFVFFAAIDVTDPITLQDPVESVTALLSLTTSAVPEPNALPVLGAGIAAVLLLSRRRLAKLL